MLEDADLSGGLLDSQLSITSGQALAAEQGREYDVTKENFFLEHICHKQMFSISGRRLIQPRMNERLKEYNVQPIPQGMTVFPA
jgi:hypothetical protein